MGSPKVLAMIASVAMPTGAAAQVVLDRADPTVIQRTLPQVATPAPVPSQAPAAPPVDQAAVPPITGVIRAVTINGQAPIPLDAFAEAIAAITGQELGRDGLAQAADRIAAVARARGYPFATATIPAQPLTDGVLRVTIDLGRIDAVRVIGKSNAAADRILARALRRGQGVRQRDLERALLLVGDLPGVRVVDTRFVRQDGFGILLVTIDADPASAYVQIDNRGSKEVGPIRSTLLASLRGIAQDGDEFAVIASQTPLQLSEFAFLRARYTAPLTASGTIVSIAGSLARSEPGGALAALDVVGRSADAAIAVQQPVVRTRSQSWWAGLELRALGSNQMIAGRTLRRDRLSTLAGTFNGTSVFGGGVLRAELTATAGLPFDGTTREGTPLASRIDGDASFVSATYALDWVRPLAPRVSVNLATAGQVASRPLLAAVELGVGGPAFARAYDYAERTGDQGILGSLEVRYDAGRLIGDVIDRAQLYGFVDGGMVDNLRQSFGGGSLASTGAGARVGTGRFDWLVEVALPLNADRFDTGNRNPRVSLRLARAF
ncbi:ShlB/FhaC/HecB family hemolysin secretion/activation protein [Sphingomonas sp. TZW2008]|uniref:ShlB/FhaC/HecB family hemolysin secretion/activation protein n=1 Tax=Sphingomonas sp. TZW2008 TaxID=1917973 RepID=UPI000A269A04|nr:ShlB/FhaC/HecB family hemolysin secretion/activation protein [Sphingomonas sp. TZW2008]